MRNRLVVSVAISAALLAAASNVAGAAIPRGDATTDRIVSIALPINPAQQFPVAEYGAFGSVWVLAQGNTSKLLRINPRTNRVTGSVSLGYGEASGNDQFRGTIAAAGGSLWVPEFFYNTVLRIDPSRMVITHRVKVGRSPTSVIAAAGAIFVSDWHGEKVVRINPRTNRVVATIPVGNQRDFNGGPFYLAYTAHHVWASLPDAARLVEIDPSTNRVVGRHNDAPAYNCGRLDPAPGALWVDDSDCSNAFSRYDLATGRVTKTVTVPDATCLLGMAVLDGYLWTVQAVRQQSGDCTQGALVRRNVRTGVVLGRIRVGVSPFEVFRIGSSLWTNDVTSNNHVLRVTPGAAS
jgi:outer membrane protein assembly factor BamB